MRTNYNDSSNRGGRYPKRQNGGSNGGGRRPSGKRNPGQHSSNGSVNVSGVSATRNKYLDMAKEALSNGNRVEAENYFQHAEHYSKMLSAAMANKREREESNEAHNQRRYNNGGHDRTPPEEKSVHIENVGN